MPVPCGHACERCPHRGAPTVPESAGRRARAHRFRCRPPCRNNKASLSISAPFACIGKLRADRSLPSPLNVTVPFHGIAVPTEIERRGAFDAIMLVGTPVLQFLIFAAY